MSVHDVTIGCEWLYIIVSEVHGLPVPKMCREMKVHQHLGTGHSIMMYP